VEDGKELPRIGIAPSDLRVIGYALFPYAQMIHRLIEPSPKRDTILRTIETLRRRIAAVKIPLEGDNDQIFPIMHDELAVIDSALSAFIENIGRYVPQSQERDETMRACEALRSYLISSFTPPGTPPNN